MKGSKFADDEGAVSAENGRMEQHNQQFFYNGI